MTRRFSLIAAGVSLLAATHLASPAAAQSTKLLNKLNEVWQRTQDSNESWKPVLTAFLDMTKPPEEIGPGFDWEGVWPGMDRWSEWAQWAEQNQAMGKALVENETKLVFGMPYGKDKVDAAFASRGLYVDIVIEPGKRPIDCAYLSALRQIAVYANVETWRLAEAGKYEEAFKVALAALRVLRQVADQVLVEENQFAMRTMSELLTAQREVLYAHYQKMPPELLQKLSSKEYPMIRPADNEKLKRLELPEGDRWVIEEVLEQCFDDNDQPSPEQFALVFAALQSADRPLERMGAVKRWNAIAALHGSYQASKEKLGRIYDDWWRRWRTRQYDAMLSVPTELSLINPIRYAAVVLSVRDLQDLFADRRRLIAELNGTIMATATCAYYRSFNLWPDDPEKLYTGYMPKKWDFDPYDTEYGHLIFRSVATPRSVSTVWGPVMVQGAVIYARNDDHGDDQFRGHEAGGESGDFVLWPPLRHMSRIGGGAE